MLILHNGRIHTLDPRLPIARSIAIDGAIIRFTAKDDSLVASAGSSDQVIDLRGRCVLPGLTDAHIHLENYAFSLQLVDCETSTRAECIRRVAQRAGITPPGAWVRGHGWNQNLWAEGFGSAADLDAVAVNHPVFLTAKSLHAAWANSTALRMAGITHQTPDPAGGVIQRDANGQPTGILLESAVELIYAILPTPTVEEVCQNILQAQSSLWQMGITSVHDFDRQRCFHALQLLHQRGQLHLRVLKSIPVEALDSAVVVGLHGGLGDDFLKIGSVKCFADGALGPQTAAMLASYQGNPANKGMLLLTSDEIFEIGKKTAEVGLSLAVHAIGDLANRQVLDGLARLRDFESSQHLPALRHRIEHVQILAPEDADRLAQFAVIASVQPIHATSDMRMADQYWGNRSAFAYAYNALLRSGANLAFGSDAPVESPNPFWGLHAAVTRQDRTGMPAGGWYPLQRLTLQDALHGFTLGPAFAAGWEDCQGVLSPGFWADLIVLPQDPFHLPPQSLHQVQPQATMVGGEWVWQSQTFYNQN